MKKIDDIFNIYDYNLPRLTPFMVMTGHLETLIQARSKVLVVIYNLYKFGTVIMTIHKAMISKTFFIRVL